MREDSVDCFSGVLAQEEDDQRVILLLNKVIKLLMCCMYWVSKNLLFFIIYSIPLLRLLITCTLPMLIFVLLVTHSIHANQLQSSIAGQWEPKTLKIFEKKSLHN